MIQLRNNYDKLIFNGAIGRIAAVDPAKGRVGAVFDEGSAEYDYSDLDELGLAYAISIHKSQGSQYPAVVIPMHQSHYLMLRRNLRIHGDHAGGAGVRAGRDAYGAGAIGAQRRRAPALQPAGRSPARGLSGEPRRVIGRGGARG